MDLGSLGDALRSLDYGDVPTWLSAVVTSAALIVALYQAAAARREAAEALKVAHDEARVREEIREDEVASQARLVLSHVSRSQPQMFVHVENASSQPIYAVRVHSVYLHDEAEVRLDGFEWMPEGAQWRMQWERIEPGGKVSGAFTARLGGMPVMAVDDRVGATVDLEYIDARGIRWRRWASLQPRLSPAKASHRPPPPAVAPVTKWSDIDVDSPRQAEGRAEG